MTFEIHRHVEAFRQTIRFTIETVCEPGLRTLQNEGLLHSFVYCMLLMV